MLKAQLQLTLTTSVIFLISQKVIMQCGSYLHISNKSQYLKTEVRYARAVRPIFITSKVLSNTRISFTPMRVSFLHFIYPFTFQWFLCISYSSYQNTIIDFCASFSLSYDRTLILRIHLTFGSGDGPCKCRQYVLFGFTHFFNHCMTELNVYVHAYS